MLALCAVVEGLPTGHRHFSKLKPTDSAHGRVAGPAAGLRPCPLVLATSENATNEVQLPRPRRLGERVPTVPRPNRGGPTPPPSASTPCPPPPVQASSTSMTTENRFELRYFPVMAKGLGPTLVAECSGIPWVGNKDLGFIARGGPPGNNFADLKPSLPFGQLPLLTTAEGDMVVQTTAIINYIGMIAGTAGSGRDFAVSQMLIAEAEDVYAMLAKNVPTIVAPLNQGIKGDKAGYDAFWSEKLPPHLDNLERLCATGTGFGTTPGALYLFSILHQACLVVPTAIGARTALAAWYSKTLNDPRVAKVLAGESSMGPFKQYFIEEP
jgi:hypothetical protein